MLRYPGPTPTDPPLEGCHGSLLEEYCDRIAKLNQDFPQTWHLIMKAEDKCRSQKNSNATGGI